MRALDAAHQRTLKQIATHLDALYDAMVEKLATGDKIPVSWLHEAGRLEAITKLISHAIGQFAALSLMQVQALQHLAVDLGTNAAQAFLHATVPDGIHWSFGLPSLKALAELVGVTQDGSPLADLFNGFGREAAQQVEDALLRGVTLGNNPREIARDVEDALGVSRNRALTIARQESLRCYKNAATETYRENDDVVEQWRWTCALNARTCAACIAMDGTLHPLGEDLESHTCCRCQPVCVTRDWRDILSDAGIDTSSLDLPDTRPTLPTGADWLDNQSEAVQKQVLGPRYKGWKAGDFSLKDMVQHVHDPNWGHSIKVKPMKALVKK